MERFRGQKFMQTALGLMPYFLIATQSFFWPILLVSA